MKGKEEIGNGDFQKLLQIALQFLELQKTMIENHIMELNDELRTLEREDELEKLELQLVTINKDIQHYQEFVDEKQPFDFNHYYE